MAATTSTYPPTHGSGGDAIIAKYILNEKRCVSKKLTACKRENYTVEEKSSGANVVFNAGAYELFRRAAVLFFKNSTTYVVVGNPLLDQASNIAQETVRVHNKQKRNNPLAYTLSLYNTKSSLWVNGPYYRVFIDNDLPVITDLFHQFDDEIKKMNTKIEQSLIKMKENSMLSISKQSGDWNPSSTREVGMQLKQTGTKSKHVQGDSDSGFGKEMKLVLSMRLESSKEKVIQCQFCKRHFNTQDDLILHNVECKEMNQKTVQDESEDELDKPIVELANPSESSLTEHTSEMGNGEGEKEKVEGQLGDGKERNRVTHEDQDELIENIEENNPSVKEEEIKSDAIAGGTSEVEHGHIPDTGTKSLQSEKDKLDLTWQELEAKEEEEITVKLLNSSPVEMRSKRNRPPSWKVRENLDNKIILERKKNKAEEEKGSLTKGMNRNDQCKGIQEEKKEQDSSKVSQPKSSNDRRQKKGNDERKYSNKIACCKCGQEGHFSKACPQLRTAMNEESDSVFEGGSDSESDMEDDVEDMREKIQKKDSIIDGQLTEIENLKKELREARIKERKQDADVRKMISTIMEKEELLKKVNGKMAELSNSKLKELKCKFAKKVDQEVQTDKEESSLADSLTILDKLPCMNRKMAHKTNREITGKNILNINTARGQKDKCFNCFDLENKIDEIRKNNNQLKKQVVEYQEKLGKISSSSGKPMESTEMMKESRPFEEIKSDNGSNSNVSEPNSPPTSRESQLEPEVVKTVCFNGGTVDSKEEKGNELKDEEKGENMANGDDIEEYFKERNNMEEYFLRRELNRRGATHSKAGVDKRSTPSTDEQIHNLRQESERRGKNLVGDDKKDKSPLCNRFVSTGKCWKKGCRYTHKRLCRGLELEGKCSKHDCRDGHNIDGVCKHYNNKGCWNSRESCRYMHIKVKATQELTIVEGKAEESETSGCETNMCGNKEEVSENAGVETVDNAEDEIRDEFILFNGEWYCDDSTEEDEQKEDRTQSPHEENQREKIAVSHHAVADEEEKRKGTPNNQDGEEKERVTENQVQQANSNKDQKKIERDLGYFLEVDRRHDIWSQIKATKAEIKELERSMQGMKRKRREDRNL